MEFNSLQEQCLTRAVPVGRECQRGKGKEEASLLKTNTGSIPLFQTRKRSGLFGLPEKTTKIGISASRKLLNSKELERILSNISQRCIFMKTWFKKYNKFEDCAIIATYMLEKPLFKTKSSNTKQRKCPNPNILECLLQIRISRFLFEK